jgi:ElaB/YqjD/DUF883 family membrane-anchored ribosome-binding protein
MTSEVQNDAATGTGAENGGKISAATEKVRDGATAVRTKAADAYSAARERTGAAYGTARERASSAYGTARERAGDATRKASDGIDSNPELALVGGLALGAIVAALLPRTEREQQALGQYGRKINQTAREAVRAASDAGRSKLDEMGFNKETARQKLTDVASSAGEAARTAAKTSADAARQTVTGS